MTSWSRIFIAVLPLSLAACETKVVHDNTVSAKLARSLQPGGLYAFEDGRKVIIKGDGSTFSSKSVKNLGLNGTQQQTKAGPPNSGQTTATLFTPIGEKPKRKLKGSAESPQLVDKSSAGVPSVLVQPKD